jgi:hypothetical protein
MNGIDELHRLWEACKNAQTCPQLDDSQFDYCVKKIFSAALFYEHIVARLDNEQFDYCVRKCPHIALNTPHVRERLNVIQLDDCIKKELASTLRLPGGGCLNLYQKAWLGKHITYL